MSDRLADIKAALAHAHGPNVWHATAESDLRWLVAEVERLTTVVADIAIDDVRTALQQRESDEAWMMRVYPHHAWSPDDGMGYAEFCHTARAEWEAEHAELKSALAAARAEVEAAFRAGWGCADPDEYPGAPDEDAAWSRYQQERKA